MTTRKISDICWVVAFALSVVMALSHEQAQFSAFPPGTFTSHAARDPQPSGGGYRIAMASAGGSLTSGDVSNYQSRGCTYLTTVHGSC